MNLESMCQQAKAASRKLAQVSSADKNVALQRMADQIWQERGEILAANQVDVAAAQEKELSPALLDRLMLNEKRLEGIVSDLRRVVSLPDPVGEVFGEQTLPNGLRLRKQRVPLGVLAVIYEARPNVTVDVAGLALKSGNAVILRGGSETIHSNRAFANAIQRGLADTAVPVEAI